MQAPDIKFSDTSVGAINTRIGAMDSLQAVPRRVIYIPNWIAASTQKISGFVLCIAALMGILALASWNASDPSLTYANGKETQNWLGYWGASFSDLAMQFFGFASIGLLCPPLIWGLYKLTNRPQTALRYRVAAWVGSLACLAAALGCVATPVGWPLPVGLGGVVGDAVLNFPKAFLGGYPGGMFAIILGTLLAVLALYLLARACNLNKGFTYAPPRSCRRF